jgi:hypothetical protein
LYPTTTANNVLIGRNFIPDKQSAPLYVFGPQGTVLSLVNNTEAAQGGTTDICFFNNNTTFPLGKISAIDITSGYFKSALSFSVGYNNTNTFLEGMRIKAIDSGTPGQGLVYVGIGTADPSEKLVVEGNIIASGNVSANSFNATSDYRIKENIRILDDAFTVDNLKPVQYNLKESGKESIGFIAHELQEEYPQLVEGEKDGEQMQSINYNGLIPILVKEIQDLKKRIAQLERFQF